MGNKYIVVRHVEILAAGRTSTLKKKKKRNDICLPDLKWREKVCLFYDFRSTQKPNSEKGQVVEMVILQLTRHSVPAWRHEAAKLIRLA